MSVRSLNKVMLIGNLTRDPNLRFTPGGAAVCSFGLATNRSWTPTDGGEKQERVEFHNVVAWSKLAEICGQLLGKGDKVYVEGRLQTREWKGDDNVSRRTTEVVIDNMILLRSQSGKFSDGDDDMAMSAANAMGDDDSGNNSSGKSSRKKSKKASTQQNDDSDDQTVYDDTQDISDDVPF